MNDNHKEMISIALTVGIVGLAIFIIHRFIPSIIWAGIIVVSTYPLYRRWRRFFGAQHNVSALSFTLILVCLLIIPFSWLITVLVQESQWFINYLQVINREGGQAPGFIHQIPFIGTDIAAYWDKNIGQPGSLKYFLSNVHLSITPASYYLKLVGVNVAHRSFQVGFTLLSLFFFYRDGDALFQEINHVGEFCLGARWSRYAGRLPSALRATVNGTIAVGMGVGLLMGACYALVDFPAPTLMGFITAFAAMVPFVVPVVFAIISAILFFNGSLLGAIVVIVWGTIVMFVSDHFIKPVLIGGATQLPFLVVLFGILGGVETLGLLGLFVGPIIMVLFITLWYESQGCVQPRRCVKSSG